MTSRTQGQSPWRRIVVAGNVVVGWSLVLLVLATLAAMAAAVYVSSAGQAYGDIVADWWADLRFWLTGLF